jgi:hypothetical protein
MSTTLVSPLTPKDAPPTGRTHWRLVPAFETNPALVGSGQTVPGKLVVLTVFAGMLHLLTENWLAVSALILLITFLPEYRRGLIACGTVYWLMFHNSWFDWALVRGVAQREGAAVNFAVVMPIGMAALIAFAAGFCWIAFRWRTASVMRRPMLLLGLCYTALLLGACYAPVIPAGRVYLWTGVLLLGPYFWFIGYTLLDRNSKDRDPLALQMGGWFPFWVGSAASFTPFPKGAAYLRRIEARTPADFAVTQIKGVKLLLWTLLLSLAIGVFRIITHVWLHIPPFPEVFRQSIARHPYPWFVAWASLIGDFLETMLSVSIVGSGVVACCRMTGFRAFRNTYRPFRARTIAEFWNRYYYYFKELLVEFFFYPAFARYFKGHRRVRIFFATLSAATLGNLIYHFIRDIHYVAELGLGKALVGFHVYGFHCLVLGIAIGISQLRGKKRPVNGNWLREQVVPAAGMLGFFCVLHIFNYDFGRTCPIREHFRFLLSLIGVS